MRDRALQYSSVVWTTILGWPVSLDAPTVDRAGAAVLAAFSVVAPAAGFAG